MINNLFSKLGGRKFVMAVVVVIAGALIDINTDSGLSTNMLGLLTAVYATFTATNTLVSRKAMDVQLTQASQSTSEPASQQAVDQQVISDLARVIGQIDTALQELARQQADMVNAQATSQQALSAILAALSPKKSIDK